MVTLMGYIEVMALSYFPNLQKSASFSAHQDFKDSLCSRRISNVNNHVAFHMIQCFDHCGLTWARLYECLLLTYLYCPLPILWLMPGNVWPQAFEWAVYYRSRPQCLDYPYSWGAIVFHIGNRILLFKNGVKILAVRVCSTIMFCITNIEQSGGCSLFVFYHKAPRV